MKRYFVNFTNKSRIINITNSNKKIYKIYNYFSNLTPTQKCLLTTLKCLMAKKQKMSANNGFPLDKRIGVTLVGKLSSEPTGRLSADQIWKIRWMR